VRAFLCLLSLAACTAGSPPPSTPNIGTRTGTTASVSVTSIVGVPGDVQGSSWSFPPEQQDFGVRLVLDGLGTIEADVVLSDGEDAVVYESHERIELDGPRELSFDGLSMPQTGTYRLRVDVRGPGIRQSSTVTVRRG
jgi:hypothetical protein